MMENSWTSDKKRGTVFMVMIKDAEMRVTRG